MTYTVLAVGAAGKFAGMVVPELAKRGAKVRGFVRSPDEIQTAKALGAAEVIVGDLADEASVRSAIKDVDRVSISRQHFYQTRPKSGYALLKLPKMQVSGASFSPR